MHIQLHTDRHIEATPDLDAHVEGLVRNALDAAGDQITRVEVHLSDQNADKGGLDDKKCVMEARIAGRAPMAVTHRSATVDQAIEGAAAKLQRRIESALREPELP